MFRFSTSYKHISFFLVCFHRIFQNRFLFNLPQRSGSSVKLPLIAISHDARKCNGSAEGRADVSHTFVLVANGCPPGQGLSPHTNWAKENIVIAAQIGKWPSAEERDQRRRDTSGPTDGRTSGTSDSVGFGVLLQSQQVPPAGESQLLSPQKSPHISHFAPLTRFRLYLLLLLLSSPSALCISTSFSSSCTSTLWAT